jgi:hypothetical protein
VVTMTKIRTNRRTIPRRSGASRYDYVSTARGKAMLDRQARRYLKMSGSQFVAAYRSGAIEDPDRSEVVRVAMLLPFADR